ncbi:4-azaleucine resistance probable transporter AzlC [Halolactibacillus halophilus]|uniref:4-azaleucine resistance probable transporter AzlC n=1 Tax=Halolactibacillus halophilus TaxID=306540 RepID=A0A1I5MUP9_9BACI|nr:AzlC family ABC transporter permease [Halolactibacillus halophilus]GEM01262.1 autotransporter [Halolactibacillus halophilus]SFP12796.1 4-azaleucine resistance probable transporter AzlC [Halolactibacillus halophilus]
MRQQPVVDGLITATPIMIGYLPIALAYGVLANQAGLGLFQLTSMSALVFGGASQFMVLNMMLAQATYIELVLATFVLNFRHFIMSLSMSHRLRQHPLKEKVFLGSLTTDESFSVLSVLNKPKQTPVSFYLTLHIAGYVAWVMGSLLGGVIGTFIPETLGKSFGISLYAMFIALLLPSVKKEWRYGVIALLAMFFNYVLMPVTSIGIRIVLATLLASFIGVLMKKKEVRE